MIKVVEGNIIESGADIICHQTNCLGIMGGGLAYQIKQKYPIVYFQYKELCESKYSRYGDVSPCLLGAFSITEYGKGKYVANLFGQYKIGARERQTDYNALTAALLGLRKHTDAKRNQFEGKEIAFPYKLGCGLAGGDWGVVSDILSKTWGDCDYMDVTIYKWNG